MRQDSDLLFGMLAVQLGLATPQQVMAAAGLKAKDSSQPLGDRLLEQGTIKPAQRDMLDAMVSEAVGAHAGDLRATISSLGGQVAVMQSFGAQLPATLDAEYDEVPPGSEEGGEDAFALTTESPGRYRFEHRDASGATSEVEIGRGGLGRVLVASDDHLGREVAVKILLQPGADGGPETHTALYATSEVVTRFLREARVTGQLEHPNIVPVYEVGRRRDGTLYYTMKLVRGRTLAQALAEARDLEERLKVLGHFQDLCDAIAYAHSRGVVHRDIKPANVMLGEFGETVVLDWGLAKVRGRSDLRGREIERAVEVLTDGDVAKTIDGQAIGTPAYMSPEQAAGKIADIDERSDVWSLGAVLFEILTGETPFQGGTPFDVIERAQHEDVRPAHGVAPEVPRELSIIAAKALKRGPALRYQTAKELADEVDRFRSGLRVASYVYSPWELLRRFSARHQAALSVAAIGVALLIGLAVVDHQQLVDQRNRALQAERDARQHLAAAEREGAAAALERGDLLEARAKLRTSMEIVDSVAGRGIWARLASTPVLWRKELSDILYAVAFAPDGRTLAVGSHDGSITLIDAQTLDLRVLRGHEDWVVSLSFASDSRRLASASMDGTIKLWDAGAGVQMATLKGHTDGVRGVAFSPDGRRLASCGADRSVRLWDVLIGEQLFALEGHREEVRSVSFSPDGRRLASAGNDREVRIWDLESRRTTRVLTGHLGEIWTVRFSPDGATVASGGKDLTVRLWDLDSDAAPRIMSGHVGVISNLAFSPDGDLLATASLDRSLRVWDMKSGETRRRLEGHAGQIYDVAFAPDGRRVVSAGMDHEVRLWDLGTADDRPVPSGHHSLVYSAAFSPDGALLVTGGMDHSVRLWDVASGEELKVLAGHNDGVYDVSFSADGQLVASSSLDRTVRLWDIDLGLERLIFEGHTNGVASAVFSPDGTLVASGGFDRVARIWEVATGREQRVMVGHSDAVLSVAFSPGGQQIATASVDGTVRLWDASDGRELRLMRGHTSAVNGLAFAPDGGWLATGSRDRTVRIWDLASGEGRVLGEHGGRVHWLSVSPDGGWVGAGSSDHKAVLWEVATGASRVLTGHRSEVNDLAFSPDGRLVATASDDETVRVWSAATGAPYWRAPVLLPRTRGAPLMFTHQGWSRPGEQRGAEVAPAARWRVAVERADHAVPSLGGEVLCLRHYDGHLELWERDSDHRVMRVRLEQLRQVVATTDGCLALAGEVALLFDRAGGRIELAREATAVAADREGALVATGNQILAFTSRGEARASYLTDLGVSTMLRVGPWLLLGYLDGSIERLEPAGRGRPQSLLFEGGPASPVVRMVPGPMGMVIGGYSNGLVGLWELKSGRRFDAVKLHGPAAHLLMVDDRLYAATALGDSMVWNLGVFRTGYCAVLRQIWERVPVAWADGRPTVRAAPRRHRCSAVESETR